MVDVTQQDCQFESFLPNKYMKRKHTELLSEMKTKQHIDQGENR